MSYDCFHYITILFKFCFKGSRLSSFVVDAGIAFLILTGFAIALL